MEGFHKLQVAVQLRDFARLRQLVQGGIDINCRDSMKRTVLHHEAANDWGSKMEDVILTLVDLGANINAMDLERKTPLHYTLSEKPIQDEAELSHLTLPLSRPKIRHHLYNRYTVKFLVELGADINAQFDRGVTSLHRAIQQKNIRGIETLLRLGVDVNAAKTINCTVLQLVPLPMGESNTLYDLVALGTNINSVFTQIQPLLEAGKLGRIDIMKMLLRHGADVNSYKIHWTPVLSAIQKRCPEAVRTMCILGADLDDKLILSSIVNETVKSGRVHILECLVKYGAADIYRGANELTALQLAVLLDLKELVTDLVQLGADVNVRYSSETSPLVTAMRLGDTDIVKLLVKLEPLLMDTYITESTTVLQSPFLKDPLMMKLLLNYGGDVNLRYTLMCPVHLAVAQGNGQLLRVLVELGANINSKKLEGIGLLHDKIACDYSGDRMAMIKLLVEAGLDLNQCYNENVTPLHDAVRLGDANMVQILGELKADMNALKHEGKTPLITAIENGRTDLIRYFIENGANVNSRMTLDVNPFHDAVRQGNVDMVRVLTSSGAFIQEFSKQILTALHLAVTLGNNELVTLLLECGADINATAVYITGPLHDAVERSDLAMISALLDYGPQINRARAFDIVTPLETSIYKDQSNITETLLKCGADINGSKCIHLSPLDVALNEGKIECAALLMSRNMIAYRDTIGSSPLHSACGLGHTDQARLLILAGSDVNKLDYFGRKPLENLPLANTADYHVLQETVTAAKVKEQVPTSIVSLSGCQDMTTSLHTPGIGDVHCISSPSAIEITGRINKLLVSIAQQCKAFSEIKLKPIGSVAEGTRVGLPNDYDFLFEVQFAKDEERKIIEVGNGYAKYCYIRDGTTRQQQAQKSIEKLQYIEFRSAEFHSYFTTNVMNEVFDHSENDEKAYVYVSPTGAHNITDTIRPTRSLIKMRWNDGKSFFDILVDIVLSLHIKNWPEGATTRTWLMDEQELRSRGYVLVPKPPHDKSDLAKEYTEEELHTLWKISFPHLETEHMQRLEQRIKDVYITAKCLMNPDVCRIMITDDGSLPRSVGKYVTSYMLKMCFFQNVDYFCEHHMTLEEMVCKVYDDLVLGLSKNFIPIFFLPNVSALNGVKVDVPKSAKVAKIMARFVRALYLRDSLWDITDSGDDLVITVYQRKPRSVYRVYDISNTFE